MTHVAAVTMVIEWARMVQTAVPAMTVRLPEAQDRQTLENTLTTQTRTEQTLLPLSNIY